ncbi:hypothetical protein LT330_006399 [Penicillium expansum]|nr:hypothetical protein LT330_006399 [Penicillium expansum]
MLVTMSGNPEAYLSIRTTCDRCRFHKLKCHPARSCFASDIESGGPEFGRCQRCIRAGTPCIFSRRTKSRRATRNVRTGQSSVQITRGLEDDVQDCDATRSLNPSRVQLRGGVKPGPAEADATLARSETPDNQRIAELSPFEDAYVRWPLENELHFPGTFNIGDNANAPFMYTNSMVTGIGDMQPYGNYETLPGQSRDDENIERGPMMPQALTPVTNETQSSSGRPGSEVNGTALDGTASMGMLLRLVADLHTRLAVLETISWRSECSFQDVQHYPIGSVLHLSQTFTSLVHGFNSSIFTDPAVAPILFSCYVTLTKIYTVVLHQFQNYLHSQPSGRQVCTSQLNMRLGPDACLADVPQSNAPRSNVHTGICVLLESLQQAEKAMPADLDVKALHHVWPQPWQGLSDATSNTHLVFRALADEVADIKQLLREKADL